MNKKKHLVDTLFVLTLFGMYAAAAFMVLALGINSYKRSVAAYQTNYNYRTSLLYIAEKIRQNDEAGRIRLDEIEGGQALVLEQHAGEYSYETWIFARDGSLREATVEKGYYPQTSDGWAILEINSFYIEMKGNILEITQEDTQGNTYTMRIFTQCNLYGEATDE